MINISNGEFYGPFDLLLDLIKKSKYNIYDVKLSEITNEYINTISNIDIPIDEVADFILIATQLLFFKTKALIEDNIENQDDEEFVDENELKNRLQKYNKIKLIVPKLRKLEENGLKKFIKLKEDLSIYQNNQENIIYDVNELKIVLENLISIILKNDEFQVERILNIEEYSLEKYSLDIKLKLIKEKILSISKMLKNTEKKSEAIIIFLAILELSKNNNLKILQNKNTEEIIVKLKDI